MSSLSDALAALKNVVLMQERLDSMRNEHRRLADDLGGLTDYILSVDKRLVRIETMIEMSMPRGPQPPAIEG